MIKIPHRWNWATLEEIGKWTGGGTPSKRNASYWQGGDIPWVSPKDMKVSEISETEDYVTEGAVQKSSAKRIPAGSVLFVTRSGILEHTLPTALTRVDVTVNQDLKALTPDARVDPSFLLYYTQSEGASILRKCSKDGTTVASLESSQLYAYPIPVPPLAEQRRIVEKIEELFSDLDAGIADLKRAQRQLQRYRQSACKPPSKAASRKPGAGSMTRSRQQSCWSASWRSGANSGKKTTAPSTRPKAKSRPVAGRSATRSPKRRTRRGCRSCQKDGPGVVSTKRWLTSRQGWCVQ